MMRKHLNEMHRRLLALLGFNRPVDMAAYFENFNTRRAR